MRRMGNSAQTAHARGEPAIRANQPWSEPAALALVDGAVAFGLGEWARILDAVWLKRVDFLALGDGPKDKWRNLCNSADKPEAFKFRLPPPRPSSWRGRGSVRAQRSSRRERMS